MSYRVTYENVHVTSDNIEEFRAMGVVRIQIGDVVQVRHDATEVDLRPFAQLADALGVPYPDEP